MATILLSYCANALRVLTAQFQASSALTHGTSLGTIREQMIRDFLEDHLPSLVTFVSGQVFDAHDDISTQQDVVIVLQSVPRLPFAKGIDLIYADGVVATLEIKSSLNGGVLPAIGSGIASVRNLKPSIVSKGSFGAVHNWPADRILSVVVTYGGTSFDSLEAVLSKMKDNELPDLILDLSQGLLIRNHGLLMPPFANVQYIRHQDPAEGFMLFLTYLTEITGTLVTRAVNWRAYN